MVAVYAVFGPTASGKSAVAEALADRLGTEVVSCDALQVYRGLPILTNQPSRPTRLVAIRGLDEEMSVGAYAGLAHEAIDELVAANGVGSRRRRNGSLPAGRTRGSRPCRRRRAPGVRERIRAEVERDPAAAHRRLAELDPRAAAVVHENDARRLVRALELAEAGASLVPDDDRLWAEHTRHPTLIAGLDVPKDELERRIVERTAAMFDAGVVDEVRAALAAGVSHTAAKALGPGGDRDAARRTRPRERIVVRTRRYAAYQRKWMRRIPGLLWVDGTHGPHDVAETILAASSMVG